MAEQNGAHLMETVYSGNNDGQDQHVSSECLFDVHRWSGQFAS